MSEELDKNGDNTEKNSIALFKVCDVKIASSKSAKFELAQHSNLVGLVAWRVSSYFHISF